MWVQVQPMLPLTVHTILRVIKVRVSSCNGDLKWSWWWSRHVNAHVMWLVDGSTFKKKIGPWVHFLNNGAHPHFNSLLGFFIYIYICIYMNIVPRSCISHLPILNIHWERSLNAVIMQQVNQAACFVFEKWFKDDEPVRQQATPQG